MNIQEQINKILTDEQNQKHKKSGKWSPSLFGCCYRRQYWNRLDEPVTNPPDERNLRKFKVGLIFEKWVADIIKPPQYQVRIETPDVLGFADIVNDESVIDLKTVHSRAFWHMEKEDIKVSRYPNWLQVLWYAWRLQKRCGKLCYISKDDLTIAEYRQELDDYWLGELGKELGKLTEIWDSKTLPPADPRAYNGKECEYCQWKDKCKKEAK